MAVAGRALGYPGAARRASRSHPSFVQRRMDESVMLCEQRRDIRAHAQPLPFLADFRQASEEFLGPAAIAAPRTAGVSGSDPIDTWAVAELLMKQSERRDQIDNILLRSNSADREQQEVSTVL